MKSLNNEMTTELDKRYINENPPELIVEEGDDNNAGLPRFTLVPAQGLSSSLKKKETKDG